MPLAQYRQFFMAQIAPDRNAVLHSATLHSDGYMLVRAVTHVRTTRALTQPARLARTGGDYRSERQVQDIFGGSQWGKTLRRRMLDPLFYAQDLVEWRNHQAGLDMRSLATTTADGSIHALQEYFVPMAALERFAGALRTILRRHAVNAINVSIRHAHKDPGTLLAWARTDVFAFVLYYRRERRPASATPCAAGPVN